MCLLFLPSHEVFQCALAVTCPRAKGTSQAKQVHLCAVSHGMLSRRIGICNHLQLSHQVRQLPAYLRSTEKCIFSEKSGMQHRRRMVAKPAPALTGLHVLSPPYGIRLGGPIAQPTEPKARARTNGGRIGRSIRLTEFPVCRREGRRGKA